MSANEQYQAAVKAVAAAEAKNLSARTMQRYYKKLFAAEDALKNVVGGWSR